MIIGTAGHVDHGKTSLVRALTGIDTDRLPEEKRRGITLELGFAHLTLSDGRQIGVVDVPGHERFVKAMAAGAGGVDLGLLIVSADEGVMPQTREHLDIVTLLGVRRLLVVVTKSDLLPGLGAGWLELLELDVRALLSTTPFAEAAMTTVSVRTGEGLPALRSSIERELAVLEAVPDPRREPNAPLFLPIDRVFSAKGFGLVVTGTLWSGHLSAEESVDVLPGKRGPWRVRGVQTHGASTSQARAGTRVAVNLPELSVDDVSRGQVLTRQGELPEVKALDVELMLLPSVEHPLAKRTRQLVTLGALQVEAVLQLLDVAELRPGERCFGQLRFAEPVAALVGQRFIVRGTRAIAGRGATVGGGRVLLLNPPRRRRGAADRLRTLAEAPLETRLPVILQEAGYGGLDERELQLATGATPKELERALERASARSEVVRIDRETRRFVAGEVFRALLARVVSRLEAFHLSDPERAGLPREDLRQRLGGPSDKLFARITQSLIDERRLELEGETFRLPGRGRALTAQTNERQRQLRELLESRQLSPPTLSELTSVLRLTEPQVLEQAQRLVADGAAVRAGELFFARTAIDSLHVRLIAHFDRHPKLSTQAFKELTGLSRKFLIPLAEYFDRERITLRVGDDRVLRRR